MAGNSQNPHRKSDAARRANQVVRSRTLLVMLLLDEEDMHSIQISQTLEERADETLNLSFPYALLYRLIECGYIRKAYKKNAPDGRRRQYYQITEAGRRYLMELIARYNDFIEGVTLLLTEGGANNE